MTKNFNIYESAKKLFVKLCMIKGKPTMAEQAEGERLYAYLAKIRAAERERSATTK